MWLRQTFSNSIYLDFMEKLKKKLYRTDFSSVSNPLTRWLPNGVLQEDLLDV